MKIIVNLALNLMFSLENCMLIRCLLVENETLVSSFNYSCGCFGCWRQMFSRGGETGVARRRGLTPLLPGPGFCCTPAQGVTMMTAAGGQLTE